MPNPLYPIALSWRQLRLAPIPVSPDGKKRPKSFNVFKDGQYGWKEYSAKLQNGGVDPDDFSAMFSGDSDGIGIVCGAASGGVEMLELEGRAVIEGWLERLEGLFFDHGLAPLWERIDRGWKESTPSGGLHWYYRVSGTPVLGNTKLARRPSTEAELASSPHERARVMIETRGEGGFTVCAPSFGRSHPSGQRWQLLAGGPETMAVLDPQEYQAVHALAAMLDETPEPPAAPTPTGRATIPPASRLVTEPGELSPADAFTQSTSWADLLVPRGWTFAGQRGNVQDWARPGKHPTEGHSANTTEPFENLYVWSSSCWPLEAGKSYTKVGFLAEMDHGGDHSATVAALRRAGYGSPLREGLTISQQLGGILPPEMVASAAEEVHQEALRRAQGLGGHSGAPAVPEGSQGAPGGAAEGVPGVAAAASCVDGPVDPDAEPDDWEELTLESQVFEATPTLRRIRQACWFRQASPWAVLGATMARIMAEIPPHVVVPPIIGGDGSLNFAVALVGPSGAGKSIAEAVSQDAVLIRDRLARKIGPGSGEGLIMAFLEWDSAIKENVLKQVPQALLQADEVAQIGAVQGRNSQATFGPIVRTMLTGGFVATGGVEETRRRALEAHTYRLAIISGLQPNLAGVLLDDTDAGTPQRWVWLPTQDPQWNPPPVDWPAPISWQRPRFGAGDIFDGKVRLEVPPEAAAEVRAARLRQIRGEGDPLDGHKLLTRLKVAAGLAFLHGEIAITAQWWELSNLVMVQSAATRGYCQAEMAARAELEQRGRGRADVHREEGAREAKADKVMKWAHLVWRQVASDPVHGNAKHDLGEGCTSRCVAHALRHHKGADMEAAMSQAVDLDWVEERDGRLYPGPSRPADD